jgi:hypothetical protein
MKHIKLIAAVTLVLAAAPAFAANWVYVTESESNAVFHYDNDTIQRSGNQVTAWVMGDHSRDKTVKKRETKDRIRYNCAQKTLTVLQQIKYPDGRSETLIVKPYEQEEFAVPPDSVADAMLEAVCEATAP